MWINGRKGCSIPELFGAGLLGLHAFVLGCSSGGHLPFAGDDFESEAEASDERSNEETVLGDDDEDLPPCGAIGFELSLLRDNFYFVLDASESMKDIMPNSGGSSRHLAARRAILEMLRAVGHRVNFGAAVFPSVHSADGCAPGDEVFQLVPGEPPREDGTDNDKLEALAFTLGKHSPSGATPVASTLNELHDELLDLREKTVLFLLTDGAPNCDTDQPCSVNECIPNIERAAFVDGPVCDETFNCCATDLFPHLCLDQTGTTQELAALATSGIDTYIIGLPGSEAYASVLNDMARAAGTARDQTPAYYPVADAEELALTLTDLGEQLSASCEFDLGTPPEARRLVSVLADDEVLERDSEDGWEWAGEQTIRLLGDACTRWRGSDIGRIRAVEHCNVELR